MKLKIGVIGVGHLGKLHLKLLKEIKNAEVIGIFDSNGEVTDKLSKEYQVNGYDSVSTLLNNCDAVTIATPTSIHFDTAMQALTANKHIFIEKPITQTVEEANELTNYARKHNLKIQVGHVERFNPALLALEKYNLDPKFIQSDRLSQFNPRGTDVAVVLDLMIHDIDIILHLVKSEVKELDASGVAVVSESLDIANARIKFENGCVANVTASRISQKKMRKMRMFQKDAYITIDFLQGVSEIYRLVKTSSEENGYGISFGEIGIGERKRKIIYEQPEIPEVNALKYELNLFVESIINNLPIVVSGEDGQKALSVANLIIEKINSNKIEI